MSSSQVWLQWLVQAARHAAVSRVHVSLLPSDGREGRTAVLNTSTTEYTFRSGAASFYFYMLPGHLCLPNVAAEVRFKCFGVISLSATSGSHFIKFTKLLTGYHETDKLRYD